MRDTCKYMRDTCKYMREKQMALLWLFSGLEHDNLLENTDLFVLRIAPESLLGFQMAL